MTLRLLDPRGAVVFQVEVLMGDVFIFLGIVLLLVGCRMVLQNR